MMRKEIEAPSSISNTCSKMKYIAAAISSRKRKLFLSVEDFKVGGDLERMLPVRLARILAHELLVQNTLAQARSDKLAVREAN